MSGHQRTRPEFLQHQKIVPNMMGASAVPQLEISTPLKTRGPLN